MFQTLVCECHSRRFNMPGREGVAVCRECGRVFENLPGLQHGPGQTLQYIDARSAAPTVKRPAPAPKDGGNLPPVEAKPAEHTGVATEPAAGVEPVPTVENTKTEIKTWLKARGIAYPASARKDELLEVCANVKGGTDFAGI